MNNNLQTFARLGTLVVAAMCYPLCGMTQSAVLEVGMILEKSGEVVLTGAASETPVQAYSVLRAGTRLRVASNATARLVHNRGRLTYFVRGPAQVTITSNSLMVEPATAISSKVDSVPPVELTQPGGAPAGNKQSNTQAGARTLRLAVPAWQARESAFRRPSNNHLYLLHLLLCLRSVAKLRMRQELRLRSGLRRRELRMRQRLRLRLRKEL